MQLKRFMFRSSSRLVPEISFRKKNLPDGITKLFIPMLTLLRPFGLYSLKFNKVEFGSGKTNNATIIVQYSVNVQSKSFPSQ
jgi:hypothetical protein